MGLELSRVCGQCGREASDLIYEGPELEAICRPCLKRLDPARAAILEKLRPGSPPAKNP